VNVYLAGDFQDKKFAAQAIGELKINGIGPDDLDVFSDEPVEFQSGVLDRPSHMSLAAVTGAVTVCLSTIGFVYFTQHDYPLITGGMPLFSPWATGVVFYELTMLGAIVTTFLWFLKESGLLRRGRRAPVPAVEPGVICLRVHCGSDQADTVRRFLERSGAGNVRTIGTTA
jgi:hypothetical protein